MPSWPSRLLHTSQAPTVLQPAEARPSHPVKHGLDVDIPTSPPAQSRVLASQTSSPAPRHGRSHSHPLSSPFGQTKRGDGGHGDRAIRQHNSAASPQDATLRKASTVSPEASKLKDQDKELISGRCATCDSTVKWPRHLNVFRCTICLMVNDLQPVEDVSQQQQEKKCGEDPPELSLTKTEKAIDDCVLRYLQSSFNAKYGSPKDSTQTYGAIQDYVSALQTAPQGDAIGDSLAAKGIDMTLPEHRTRSSIRLDDSERQKPNPHTPYLSSSLPILQPSLGTNFQGEVLSSLPRSPPSLPSPAFKHPEGREHQRGHGGENDNRDSIFRPVENYIIKCFRTCDILNNSFISSGPAGLKRSVSEGTATALHETSQSPDLRRHDENIFELDAKILLLGDVAENGAWWLGETHADMMYSRPRPTAPSEATLARVSSRSPRIDWVELHRWYQVVLTAGQDWRTKVQRCCGAPWSKGLLTADLETTLEAELTESCKHLRKTLFKTTEKLLRRPMKPLRTPRDCRFLLLLLANPSLHGIRRRRSESRHVTDGESRNTTTVPNGSTGGEQVPTNSGRNAPRCHTGIIKRVLGLMANLPPDNHRHLINWFASYTSADFRKLVDLIGRFVSYRLVLRQRQKSKDHQLQDSTSVLVPQVHGPGAGSPAQLHAALGAKTKSSSPQLLDGRLMYSDDWQIKAAAKVMSLLFQANNNNTHRQYMVSEDHVPSTEGPLSVRQVALDRVGHAANATVNTTNQVSLVGARKRKRLLPTSAFYNTFLDYCNVVADFESWENRQASFSFCQYPMFLSIWAKIRILEYDARRQMEVKARQAFFNSIMSRQAFSQYLILRVRRDCLVEDSLRGVSEVVGSGQEDIKKGLRIAFQGEEGVDAGGLRKEWFLLLVREVFDPEHGLFVYDEESRYCYFNPNSFETSDQFFLVGVVLGLAIYNSTILDVALPPFAFRKLLASAPAYTGPATSSSRPSATLSLNDLVEFRPSLASGLQQLLDYDGDVEEIFCRDFVADVDRYGQSYQVPLCPNGESRAVTNSNRAEFVDLYVKYLLDTSVSRQFEPFKRGFFSVCGGNALSLFRPEEIELLVRGSDESLDVVTLRAVAIYDGWKKDEQTKDEAVIAWFWELFAEAAPSDRRALLSFITGSDRLPAMGATSLIIKLSCLGEDTQRYPMARTCFNMIGLYRYHSKEQLSSKLWTAVAESEGFGLK